MDFHLLDIVSPLASTVQEEHQRPFVILLRVVLRWQVEQVTHRYIALLGVGHHVDSRRGGDLFARSRRFATSASHEKTDSNENRKKESCGHGRSPMVSLADLSVFVRTSSS